MIVKIGGVPVTTGFGVVDALHSTPHNGIDLAVGVGTKLYAIGSGTVEQVVNYGVENAGKTVILKLDNGMRVVYGHLSEWKVHQGQHIDQGQLVALSGNTGHSTGPHLHLAVQDASGQYIDPSRLASGVMQSGGNPIKDMAQGLQGLNDTLHDIGYWINPVNLAREAWQGLEWLVTNPETANFLMSGSIIGIILVMFGAKWPKKWLFWAWLIYWTLRGFVFN